MFRTLPFTSASFELLGSIHANPTKQFYESHKGAFKADVEEPFQRMLRLVAKALPSQVRALMETKEHLFSRFLKNDFGRGGAWDFYWGAFYTKGGRRTEGAQLYLCIDRNVLKFGFYIGVYAREHHERFTHNCRANASELLPYLRRVLPETIVSFDTNDGGVRIAPGARAGVRATWESYLRNPYLLENDVCIRIPKQAVLATTERDLVASVTDTHVKLFPLVLLAVHDDPLPLIRRYPSAVGLA
jgi:5-methylcytosine-specific restriction protein B